MIAGMDIERPHARRRRWTKRILFLSAISFILTGATIGVSRLKPALPLVDRQSILMGTVQRGIFLREVRGAGTLAPEEEVWVTAGIEGRIRRLPLKPGVQVHPDTILIEMVNPSLDLELLQGREALKAAQADLLSRETEYEDQVLTLKSDIAELNDEYKTTKLESSGNEEMCRRGYLPGVKLDLTKLKLEAIERKIKYKKQTLARYESTRGERLAAAHGQVEQARATIRYKLEQAERLKVRAGVEGVLMEFSAEAVGLGKQVTAGTVLAKVVDPSRLKAQLKISEHQARDLAIGLPAHIEVMNQMVEGKVIRINPGVVEGSVTVDVALNGNAPQGARPDLSISGTIEIERVPDAVFVERPVSASGHAAGQLFKIMDREGIALRVPVVYGRMSAMTVEVVKGLNPGDQVIVSEISQWDHEDKLRIK